MTTLQMIALVCPLIFFASFVDAIAGGGGLISLPAYMMTGMPTHLALGTNKFSACIGTSFSVYRFAKSKTLHLKVALLSASFALIGSYCGAQLVLLIDARIMKILMTFLLPILAIIILFKNKKQIATHSYTINSSWRTIFLSSIIGFMIGMYDGFIGPGTGTFLILAYTTFMGFDFVTASGNAKIVNFASNFSALVVFLQADQVLFTIAIPATICSIAGAWVGSGLAIKKGAKFIRPVLLGVLSILFMKMLYDVLL